MSAFAAPIPVSTAEESQEKEAESSEDARILPEACGNLCQELVALLANAMADNGAAQERLAREEVCKTIGEGNILGEGAILL